MKRHSHIVSVLLVLASLVASPVLAFAQNARILTADTKRILDVTFDPPSATQLNTDAAVIGEFVSIAFRDDGADGLNLIAADRQRGKILFYPNSQGTGAIVIERAMAGAPLRPASLSLDVHKDLFGTSSSVDSQGRSSAKVWVLRRDPGCTTCLPGGYAPNVGSVDGTVEIVVTIGGVPTLIRVIQLEETRFVPTNLGPLVAGDLLVLSSNPPAVLKYPKAALDAFLAVLAQGGVPTELSPEILVYPGNADVDPARRFPAGAVPSGMEFTPSGNLLVPAGNGTILEYRPDGTRLSDGSGFVDFVTGLGAGKLEVAVGPQNGTFRAFVSDSQGADVKRYDIGTDGRGTLAGTSAGLFPLGVATSTANVIQTPAGSNVEIQLTDLMHSTIETVDTGGAASASVILFEDPRESEESVPYDEPLHRSLKLSEIRADLPPDAEIPAYVRAFRKGDPVTGPPTFLLVLVDTHLGTAGVISHVVDEAPILGYEPDCADPDTKGQQRLFYLPSPAEAPILESPKFIDISTDCGTSRGKFRTFSLFLASARDTRSTFEIAQAKLLALSAVLDQATCIESSFAVQLRQKVDAILFLFSRNRYPGTIAKLVDLDVFIKANPDAFAGCTINTAGELRARADSAVFILGKLPPAPFAPIDR